MTTSRPLPCREGCCHLHEFLVYLGSSFAKGENLRVAIVHDWLNQIGGAEQVLEALVELFPGAPIYTSIYWPERMPQAYRHWDIRTMWMDRLPGIYRHHQPYLLLYPLAFGQLELSGYDLIVSNKSAFCLGVRVAPGTRHLCYCLTPTRFVWNFDAYVQGEQINGLARHLVRPFLGKLQRWERAAAGRIDAFVAISREVQGRIRRLYGRESAIIHPPVNTDDFAAAPQGEQGDYFLIVSRLIPYKRIDLAVEALSGLGLPLWIAGEGRDRAKLQALAGPNVHFLGRVSDAELPGLMARCRAFLFPGLEDFGIAPVQAMAAGRPVIAYAGGGALDYVVEGETGLFFDQQTPQSLAEAIRRFDDSAFDPVRIRAHAERFDARLFRSRLRALVENEMSPLGTGGGRAETPTPGP
jgi:glycosyltransferase involved in cell wall biosynthesis